MSAPEEHHSEHAGGHHGGNPAMDWIITHMGGGLDAYGDVIESAMNKTMMPIVNGWFLTAGRICIFIMIAIALLSFTFYFLQG